MITPRNIRQALAAFGICVAAAVAGTGPANAAATASPEAEQPVRVETSEGRLIRLSAPASSVFVANPEIADVAVKSPRLVYIFGQSAGETTLFAVDRNDRLIASLRIEVNHNLSRLNKALSTFVSSGDVKAVSMDGTIVLTGLVTDPADAENARRLAARFIDSDKGDVINRISVSAPSQVNLRVRIAEVERTIIKQFGFNWDLATATNDILFALGTGSIIPPAAIGLPFLRDTAADAAALNVDGQVGGVDVDVNGLIDILAQDSLVTILAEPNLTAMSGETASFLAGGEFPIPVVDDDNSVTIIFKEFGVSLAFTPTVLSRNRISMRVRPEVSELSTAGSIQIAGTVLPGIRTRRAETTVELGSGQSFAIAGLLQDASEESLRGLPTAQEIPILGELFKSDRFERNETELLIIATPYLVQPTNRRIPGPTDPLIKGDQDRGRAGFLSQSPSAPNTVPLNTASPLSQNQNLRAGFIVE